MFVAFIFLLIILCTYYLYTYHLIKNKRNKKDYNAVKQKAIEQLNKENQIRIQAEKTQKQNELNLVISALERKQQEYKSSVNELEKDITIAKKNKQKQLQDLSTKLVEEVKLKTEQGNIEIQNLSNKYDKEKNIITANFYDFVQNIVNKKIIIENELKKIEKKQQELILDYKRKEEIEQNSNFYRIQIKEEDIDDINKLKNIAKDLHSPSILYKLIYKNYYEKPFNDMVGRVVQERDNTGIYKITNIKNNRIYIGQTRQTFKNRWLSHLKKGLRAENGSGKLYKEMWIYGPENFTWEILSLCDIDELNEKEKDYIQFYQADSWGYNGNKGVG